MRLKPGDHVTVQPADDIPIILIMQRYATVSRVLASGGYMLTVGAASPPDAEFGPIPLGRLHIGWCNESGAWR